MNLRGNDMKFNHLFLILFALAVVWPSTLLGQPQHATNDTQAPLLTLDDAVSIALENNRLVKNSSLEARKWQFALGNAMFVRSAYMAAIYILASFVTEIVYLMLNPRLRDG